jgi:ankyrin repeat protein
LHIAILHGDEETVSCLISAKVDIESADLEIQPVHLAAQRSANPEILQTLLAAKANPQALDHLGKTPLMHAARGRGCQTLIKMLVEAGAGSSINLLDSIGISALHMAAVNNQSEAIQELILAKADLEVERVGVKRTPLIEAVRYEALDALKILIEAQANINAAGSDGTALMLGTCVEFLYALRVCSWKCACLGDVRCGTMCRQAHSIDFEWCAASQEGSVTFVKTLIEAKVRHACLFQVEAVVRVLW